MPRGRPSTKAAKQAARTKSGWQCNAPRCSPHAHLFVQRHLNKTERKTLWRVSRGLPQLQALRAIIEQVYVLFDLRCRTQTALDKLATLRRRVQRCKVLGDTLKKLFSRALEKALTFLTTSYCLRPRMRWSGVTDAIARCKRVSIGADASKSVRVLRWICGGKPKLSAGNTPLHHSIVHGLDVR